MLTFFTPAALHGARVVVRRPLVKRKRGLACARVRDEVTLCAAITPLAPIVVDRRRIVKRLIDSTCGRVRDEVSLRGGSALCAYLSSSLTKCQASCYFKGFGRRVQSHIVCYQCHHGTRVVLRRPRVKLKLGLERGRVRDEVSLCAKKVYIAKK